MVQDLNWWYTEKALLSIMTPQQATFTNGKEFVESQSVQWIHTLSTYLMSWSFVCEHRKAKGKVNSECQPIFYDSELTNWREKTVMKAVSKAGYQYTRVGPHMPPRLPNRAAPELVVLPFFNYTSHHYNQHPKEKDGDCTHYCPSPFLYIPLWRSLRLALDRQFPGSA